MEGLCRGCLQKFHEPTDLTPYNEKNRRLFVYSTGLQVKKTDTFTFQLCKDCYLNLKQACKFKKQCRTSDKKFKSYMTLREYGDNLEFETFLKNNEESLMLRIPLPSGNSTPAHQKQKDDDNDSTCTSIRNFMSDILQGEEVPPTEARIIRELIEEEADVLDDSLDSHWLQDDMSIDTDFRMDFGFSPFSTPRSVNYDHCYTPRKLEDEKQYKYLSPNKHHSFDMPILDMETDIQENIEQCNENNVEVTQNVKENFIIEENDTELYANITDMEVITDHFITDNGMVMENNDNFVSSTTNITDGNNADFIPSICNVTVNNDNVIPSKGKLKGNNYLTTAKILDINEQISEFVAPTTNENDLYAVQNKMGSSPLNELEYYINKAEVKKNEREKDRICTIDKNLERALENVENKEYALEQLLASPRVIIRSGASTPTIKNILFGDLDTDSQTFGTTIEKYQNVEGQNHILDDFLKDPSITDTNKTLPLIEEESPTQNDVQDKDSIKLMDIEDINNEPDINQESILDTLLKTADENIKMEPIEFDDSLFKRPFSPPYDKYDLDKLLCNICNSTFSTKRGLKVHCAKLHNVVVNYETSYKNKYTEDLLCKICGKIYKGITTLNNHLRKHEDEKKNDNTPVKCDTCQLIFSTQASLNKHKRMHNTDYKTVKRHMCSICGKTFSSLGNRKVHERRHTKDYRLYCKVCGLGFYRNADLDVHMRSHTNEKPLACHYCCYTAKRQLVLNNHIRRKHLDLLNYSCDVCKARFISKSDLRKHFKTKCEPRIRIVISKAKIREAVSLKNCEEEHETTDIESTESSLGTVQNEP